MTSRSGPGVLERAPQRPIVRLVLIIALALALAGTGIRVAALMKPLYVKQGRATTFYDMRLWRSAATIYYDYTGRLYDTERSDYYVPGSRAGYKYPPFFAAVLRSTIGFQQAVPFTAWVYAGMIVGTLVLGLSSLGKLAWWRWALGTLVVMNWQPAYEAFNDLGMEIPIVFFFALAGWLFYRKRNMWGGVALGIATGIKVYPAIAMAALFRSGAAAKGVLGAVAGFAATVVFGLVIFAPAETVRFFVEIFPRIGGTSVSFESVGVMSAIGRTLLAAMGSLPPPEELDIQVLSEEAPAAWVIWLTSAAWLAIGISLVLGSLLALKRVHRSTERIVLAIAASVCLMLVLFPTTWMSYQALLIQPVAILVAKASDRRAWVLVLLAAVGSQLNSYDDLPWRAPHLFSWARTILPFVLLMGIWTVCRVPRPELRRTGYEPDLVPNV